MIGAVRGGSSCWFGRRRPRRRVLPTASLVLFSACLMVLLSGCFGGTTLAPSPLFTAASPTTGPAPLTVQFTARSITGAREWSWSFGDGGTSTEQNPVHTYNDPGTYSVELTISAEVERPDLLPDSIRLYRETKSIRLYRETKEDYIVVQPVGCDYEADTYFPTTPGLGIRYEVTDTGDGYDDGNWWAVFQEPGSSSCSWMDQYGLQFLCTLAKEATSDGDALGGIASLESGTWYRSFCYGCPVGNTANFYWMVSLPLCFDADATWSWRWEGGTLSFSVAPAGAVMIGTVTFPNCLRVNVALASSNDYLAGAGYFLLARGIGIVEMQFTRSGGPGGTVSYRYLEHEQFTAHSISGRIVNGGVPVSGIRVQLDYCSMGANTTTDSDGWFTLAGVYGPDVVLRIGYQGHDSDDCDLDWDYPDDGYPKYFGVHGSGDTSGLVIELSTASSEQ